MRHKYMRNRKKTNRGRGQSLKACSCFLPPLSPRAGRCARDAPNSPSDDSRQRHQPAVPFHVEWRHPAQRSDPLQVLLSPEPRRTALHHGHPHYWQVLCQASLFQRRIAILLAQRWQKILIKQSIAFNHRWKIFHLAVYFFIMFCFWFFRLTSLRFKWGHDHSCDKEKAFWF